MTVQKKQAFGRILRHRLDAAKLFPNLGEKGKDFTDYIQGAPVTNRNSPVMQKESDYLL